MSATLHVIIRSSDGDEQVIKTPDAYTTLPTKGKRCPYTGRSAAWYYRRILKGDARKHIRCIHEREPGSSRGTWMVHIGDLLAWLNRVAETQDKNLIIGENSDD